MTEQELMVCARAALAKWQPRLHLDSWVLGVEISDEMIERDGQGTCGQFDGNWWHEVGKITVGPKATDDYRKSASAWPDETDEQIVERIVLHELLHCAERPLHDVAEREFSHYFGKDGVALALEPARHAWWASREMRINRMARVLIEADRSCGWRGDPKA